MGGYGSTRWQWHNKKYTTDDCFRISIFRLKQEGLLTPGQVRSGSWIWHNQFSQEKRASVGYEINMKQDAAFLRLHYIHTTAWAGEKRNIDYLVPLEKTSCHFGGYRYWFICPISVDGRYCGRRVGKLFLAPGSSYFACRHCHDLTYRSSQESNKAVNELKKLDTMTLLQAINNGEVDLLNALKALPDNVLKW